MYGQLGQKYHYLKFNNDLDESKFNWIARFNSNKSYIIGLSTNDSENDILNISYTDGMSDINLPKLVYHSPAHPVKNLPLEIADKSLIGTRYIHYFNKDNILCEVISFNNPGTSYIISYSSDYGFGNWITK